MRYGKIIEESNPKTLLTKYKENVSIIYLIKLYVVIYLKIN